MNLNNGHTKLKQFSYDQGEITTNILKMRVLRLIRNGRSWCYLKLKLIENVGTESFLFPGIDSNTYLTIAKGETAE